MNKLIILVSILVVSGCNSGIQSKEINAASKLCAEYGGLQSLKTIGDRHNAVDAYCNNGILLTLYGIDKYLGEKSE